MSENVPETLTKVLNECLESRIAKLEQSNKAARESLDHSSSTAEEGKALAKKASALLEAIIQKKEEAAKKAEEKAASVKKGGAKKTKEKSIKRSKSVPKAEPKSGKKSMTKSKTAGSKKTLVKTKTMDNASKKTGSNTARTAKKSAKGSVKSSATKKPKKSIDKSINESVVEESKAGEPKTEEPIKEEIKQEEIKPEENKQEEAKVEETVPEETQPLETVEQTAPLHTENIAESKVEAEATKLFDKESEKAVSSEEILEEHFIRIVQFMDRDALLNMSMTKKSVRKGVLKAFHGRATKVLEEAKEQVKLQEELLTEEKLNQDIPSFEMSRGTARAIQMLKTENYTEIFKAGTVSDSVLIVYRVYAYLLFSEEMDPLAPKTEFWAKFKELIAPLIENVATFGVKLKELIESKDFTWDDMKIFRLKQFLGPNTELHPNSFTNDCATTGFLCFFIKDLLEYFGIMKDKKTPISRKYKFSKAIEEIQQTNVTTLEKYLSLYD